MFELVQDGTHVLTMANGCEVFFPPNRWKLWDLSPDRLRGGPGRP